MGQRRHTEKMSPVYICQNDNPMTSLALSTAHQVKKKLCQPHSLKGCHIFVINLPNIASNSKTFLECKHLSCQIANFIKQISAKYIHISSVLKVRSQFVVRLMEFHEKDSYV